MPLFRADAALMEQVIANLLLNAALHTPPGTAIFLAAGVGREPEPGCSSPWPTGVRAFLWGCGSGSFQKFQRGDAARAGGLGLGLSIIRGFVVAQGGEVVVGNNPGGGAVFTVYLPYVPPGEVPE